MTETKPRINRGNRGASHLEEQPSESNVPPNARGSDFGQA